MLVDPSGLSANRVTRNGADDNQCFGNVGGALAGNVINAACLNTPMGAEVVTTVAGIPPQQYVIETIVFAKPSGGSGDGDSGSASSPGRHVDENGKPVFPRPDTLNEVVGQPERLPPEVQTELKYDPGAPLIMRLFVIAEKVVRILQGR